MGSFDFYSPFISAAIIKPERTENPRGGLGLTDGERFPLWTTPKNDLPILPELKEILSLPFLQEVQIEFELSNVPQITATLTPPYDHAMEFLDSKLVERYMSVLEVQFGYTAGTDQGPVLSPVFRGTIEVSDVSLGVDTTITLRAQGVGAFSSARQERGQVYGPASRAQILESLAKGPDGNRALRVDLSEVREEGFGSEPRIRMFEEKVTLAQGGNSDWITMWRLVREARCWMYSTVDKRGPVLKVFPREKRLVSKPVRTYRMFHYPGGEIGPSNGEFPILSVSSPTTAVYLPGAVRGLSVRGMSSKTRARQNRMFDDSSVAPVRFGPGGKKGKAEVEVNAVTPGLNRNNDGGELFFADDADDSEVAAEARAEYEELTEGMGIKLNLETLGDPTVAPGDIVAVRGIGKRLSANYAVTKISHSLGLSGPVTSLELISNMYALEDGVFPVGVVNTKEPRRVITQDVPGAKPLTHPVRVPPVNTPL